MHKAVNMLGGILLMLLALAAAILSRETANSPYVSWAAAGLFLILLILGGFVFQRRSATSASSSEGGGL